MGRAFLQRICTQPRSGRRYLRVHNCFCYQLDCEMKRYSILFDGNLSCSPRNKCTPKMREFRIMAATLHGSLQPTLTCLTTLFPLTPLSTQPEERQRGEQQSDLQANFSSFMMLTCFNSHARSSTVTTCLAVRTAASAGSSRFQGH
jgi:hypothetical protein